jgi:hypothetical protein
MMLQEKERVVFDDVVSTVSSQFRVCMVHSEAPASHWREPSKGKMTAQKE